jgi:hypothetical protein
VTRGERRDFILDSGAVSRLAGDDNVLDGYRRALESDFVGSLHIPSPLQAEIHTGVAKHDARIDRMVNRISRSGVKVYITSDDKTNRRAGELRYLAQKALGKPKPGDEITGIDALIVAIAERLSHRCSVTILTTDLKHIQALVHATGAKNIDVKLPR